MSMAQAGDEVESSRRSKRRAGAGRGRRKARVVAAVASLAMALLCQVAAPQFAGALPAGNQIRVSQMGPEGVPDYGPLGWPIAVFPDSVAVAYSPDANRYLVVWTSKHRVWARPNGMFIAVDEVEIWGQMLDGSGKSVGGDFRISQGGPTGNEDYATLFASVAYNPADKEFFVVWSGNDDLPGMALGETEVFGQRISLSGTQVGLDDVRLSQNGPDGDPRFKAVYPTVAYNTALNEYLVVWQGHASVDDGEETEIFFQRVSAGGTEIGADTRITNVGPDGDPKYDAEVPDVVYNAAAGEYLVVFSADDNVNGMKDEDIEILGQRLSAKPGSVGTQIGSDDFRISHMGPDAGADQLNYHALIPAVALDPNTGRYLVVWESDHHKLGGVDDDFDIWGQALLASGASAGQPAGSMIRISKLGPDPGPYWWSGTADVAYNAGADEFLVTWAGEDNTPPLVDGELEIYGQAVSTKGGTAKVVGPDDFRISDMTPNGNANFDAHSPAVAVGPGDYLVTWGGDTRYEKLVANDYEVWARRVAP